MKRYYILILLFLIFIVSITVIGSFMVTGNKHLVNEKDILDIQTNKESYFNVYSYDLSNPNVVINPYENSPLTALVMFETKDYSQVNVIIKGKYDNDISYTFDKDKYHLIPIYGLYPDYNNTVIIESENVKKIINIETDPLPDDFIYKDDMILDNYNFYNVNYPYAIDSHGDVRWYLNRHYYGNVTVLDNANILVGSDSYTEEEYTISLYKMNLLGKICNEYLLKDGYYGLNGVFDNNVIIKSSKYLNLDLQTGTVKKIEEEINDDAFNNYTYSLYNNVTNYNLNKSVRLGTLKETEVLKKKIPLIKYKKGKLKDIDITIDSNRIKVVNNRDEVIFIVLDKLLDKRVYEVNDIKYINLEELHGKYTIYYKINHTLYKTDYYIEV